MFINHCRLVFHVRFLLVQSINCRPCSLKETLLFCKLFIEVLNEGHSAVYSVVWVGPFASLNAMSSSKRAGPLESITSGSLSRRRPETVSGSWLCRTVRDFRWKDTRLT